jgi:DNA polymerase-3 subunit gamma/tau
MQTMAGDAPGTAQEKPANAGFPAPASPLALYRKYRPATFAEVRGQEHVTEPLRQALRNGRVHHAYLFSGPRGCGKTSSARILARSLNCEQGPTPDPCGVCASCVALAPAGPGSIDVIEIDAASHGGVDDARDLRERAFYAPVSGRFKIYIIDEAHMVTREGFNALLKLVEEPPPHLKFVFATTEPEKVIATIRSRTHHYPFRLVPPAVLRELLEQILAAEDVAYQPAVLPLVVRAGAGSVRDALSILDQLLAGSGPEGLTYDRTVALLGYTDDSLLDEIVNAFATGDGAAVFGAVDRVVEGGHDPRRFAADLLDRLRDLIILAAVPGAGQSGLLDAPADRLERMAEQSGRFGQAELTRAAEIISEGLIQMRGTTSPRLLLELTCAQVLLPAASTGEKALLARLERLEHQLAGVEVTPLEPSGKTVRSRSLPAQQAAGQPAGPAGAPGEPARPRDGRERRPGSREDTAGAGASPSPGRAGEKEGARQGGEGEGRTSAGAARADRAREGKKPAAGPSADAARSDRARDGEIPAGRPSADGAQAGRARENEIPEGRPPEGGPSVGRAREDPATEDRPMEGGATGSRATDGGSAEGLERGTGSTQGGASQGGPSGSTAAQPGAGRDPGAVDADTLRQRWPEILDMVRSKGKVAWMLLNTASVQELENGVLTIAFPSGGNARGFANSGHDQILADALAAMLGLNVRVRAVSGGPPLPPGRGGGVGGQGTAGGQGAAGGQGKAGRQGSAGHGNPSGPAATDTDPSATGQPATDAQAQDPPASDATAQDPPASHGPAQEPPAPDGTARHAPASGGTASARPAPDSPASGPRATDRRSAGRTAKGTRASEPAGSAPATPGGSSAGSPRAGQAQPARSRHAPSPGPAAVANEEWPDDATGPGAADGLSGMELIQRQLGGRVIEEIEDT